MTIFITKPFISNAIKISILNKYSCFIGSHQGFPTNSNVENLWYRENSNSVNLLILRVCKRRSGGTGPHTVRRAGEVFD